MPSDSESADVLKARRLLGDLRSALVRLAAAIAEPETEFIRDAAIQRFEFTFELGWKAIQAVARFEGHDCSSPRTAISLAWRSGWVTDDAGWLDILEDRNCTSHTYREALAREVFRRLPGHLTKMLSLHQALESRIGPPT